MVPDAWFLIAEDELDGVGDRTHEWRQIGNLAVHLRRRLTEREAFMTGPIVDIRGTRDAYERIERVRKYLPVGMQKRPACDLP